MIAYVKVVASGAFRNDTWDFCLDKLADALILLGVRLLTNIVLEQKKSKLARRRKMANAHELGRP